MRRTLVSLLVLCSVAAAACSSDPFDGRKAWDKNALASIEATRVKVAATTPGLCTKLDVNDFATFRNTVKSLGLTALPIASGTCDLEDQESIEIAEYKDARTRDAAVNQRAAKLCRIALHPKGGRQPVLGFPGLRFVVGGNWSVQVDSQGRGRQLAEALQGTYVGKPCENDVSDWDAAALDRMTTLLGRLDATDCPSPQVDDHEAVRVQQYYRRTLPAASTTCAVESSKVHLLEFGPKITDRASYMHGLADYYCLVGYSTKVVSTDSWGAVTIDKDPQFASRVATALGGTVDPYVCPPKAQRVLPTSTTAGAAPPTTTAAP